MIRRCEEQEFPSPYGGGQVGVASGDDGACGQPHLNPPLKGEETSANAKPEKHKRIKYYTHETLKRSRELRKNPTDAEKKLWRHLCKNQLDGFKFRRQFPIGSYIADFVCVEAKLVIEADGGQHSANGYNELRDAYMREQGYRLLRFWNNDILENIEGVVETIGNYIVCTTPDSPPLLGEGQGGIGRTASAIHDRSPLQTPPQPSPNRGGGSKEAGI